MNIVDPGLRPVLARTDAEDRLVEADPRLLDLVEAAGGSIGAPIAVPQIAALVRLARRLGIAVARQVVVADGEGDLELSVRATPERDGVLLQIGEWRPRAAWRTAADGDVRPFLRSGADWLWETDAALRLTHISADAGERYGFDADALLGQPLVNLFTLAEDGEGGFPILSALAAQMRFDAQDATLKASGKRVRLSAEARIDARGRFAGFDGAATMLDIEVPAEEPAPSTIPDGFSARLDRSLRAPLERIIANASSMSARIDGPLSDSYTGYAEDIAAAGRHLLGLVSDLVDLEAVEREDFTVAPEPIDLADVARRAAGLLSVRAAEGKVRIDKPASEQALPATGDFRRALQVLVNLIGNAVRYSPEDATVWVEAERDGNMACVVVADQGKGIAESDQAMIFDKFGRVDPREPGGSGLGLYISRRLARAMGGDIIVDSAPGRGARFLFTLPAR